MKTIKLLTAFLLLTVIVYGQDIHQSQVPSVVVNSFKMEFPKAKDVEWERDGDNYNVDFEIDFFTDYEAWFDASGKLIHFTEEISSGELPKAVKDAIKTQYSSYRIDDVKKINENGIISYRVEVEKRDDERHLSYSEDGKLL